MRPGLNGGMTEEDPSLTLDAFQGNMLSELRDREFQAARLGETDEVGALSNLAKSYAADRAGSPLARQGAEIDAQSAADLGAQSEGFDATPMGMKTLSPSQTKGAYGRKWGEWAAERPYKEAQARDAAAMARTQATADASIRRQQLIEETKRNQYQEFNNLLQGLTGGQTTDGRQVNSIRPTAQGPSITFGDAPETGAGTIPQGLLNKLTDATNQWAVARSPSQKAQALMSLQQARNAVISQYAGDEGNKYFVQEMMSSPETMDLPVQQWIEMFQNKYAGDMDAGDFTDADMAQIQALSGLLRGVPQR